jgi:hypothetical protein
MCMIDIYEIMRDLEVWLATFWLTTMIPLGTRHLAWPQTFFFTLKIAHAAQSVTPTFNITKLLYLTRCTSSATRTSDVVQTGSKVP